MREFSVVFVPLILLILFSCSAGLKRNHDEVNSLPPLDERLDFKISDALVDTNYMERWDTLLFQEGDLLPNFVLHTLAGQKFDLYSELEKNKPMLLITGSYTCYIARGNLPAINSITKKFDDELTTVMIFTTEAHPIDTVSPYSMHNDKWVAEENTKDGIEAIKPRTYGDRLKLCRKWVDEFDIKPLILVDDPKNVFWSNYGQAPNLAYLVDRDGRIHSRHIWLDPESLEKTIEAFLP